MHSHYLKRLIVEHDDDDDDDDDDLNMLCETLSNEMTTLKKLRHINIMQYDTSIINLNLNNNWNFDLIYNAYNGIVYEPLSNYIESSQLFDKNEKNNNFCDMLDICQQVGSALEFLHNPNKAGGSVAHLHINLNTILLQKDRTKKMLTLSSQPKWQVKLSGLELSIISNSAYCEDDIYENNTNDPAFVGKNFFSPPSPL